MSLFVKLTPNQIENWVARHFDYKRRKDGEELLICNPFIPGDNKYKFNISTVAKQSKRSKTKNYWVHDWRPSAKQYNGSFIKFVQRYKGLSFKEAIKDICGESIDLRSIITKTPTNAKTNPQITHEIKLPENAIPITDSKWGTAHKMALNYLTSRGIQLSDAISFRLHYTPTMIIFPYTEYDNIVYWQGRTFSHFNKRFLFPNKTQTTKGKSDYIYGFDNTETNQPLYIVEAIYCALTIGPGCIAMGGAKLSNMQQRKIKAINPSSIILAPDNDKEGLTSLFNNWKILNQYYKMYYVIPPKGCKDWNDYVKNSKNKQQAILELKNYINSNTKELNLKKAIEFKMSARD